MANAALFLAQLACRRRDYTDPPNLGPILPATVLRIKYRDIATLIAAYRPLQLRELYASLSSDLNKAKSRSREWHKAAVYSIEDDKGFKLVTLLLDGVDDRSEYSNVGGDLICFSGSRLISLGAGRMYTASFDKDEWRMHVLPSTVEGLQKGDKLSVWRFSK